MQKILTHQSASVTELREPNKVIEQAGDEPVAIMNRNTVVGYFVPASKVDAVDVQLASSEGVKKALKKRKKVMKPVNTYLRDK